MQYLKMLCKQEIEIEIEILLRNRMISAFCKILHEKFSRSISFYHNLYIYYIYYMCDK